MLWLLALFLKALGVANKPAQEFHIENKGSFESSSLPFVDQTDVRVTLSVLEENESLLPAASIYGFGARLKNTNHQIESYLHLWISQLVYNLSIKSLRIHPSHFESLFDAFV